MGNKNLKYTATDINKIPFHYSLQSEVPLQVIQNLVPTVQNRARSYQIAARRVDTDRSSFHLGII